MARRFSALLLLSFLFLTLLGSTTVFALDKPYVASHLSKTRVAPAAIQYYRSDNPPANPMGGKDVVALNATDHANNIIGYTTYDYQNNALMRRQVEHRGTGYIHFAWMWMEVQDAASETRDLRYYGYNLSSCFPTAGATGTGMGAGRAGYVALDVYYPTAFPIPSAHLSGASEVIPTAYYDFGWSTGSPIGLYETDQPTDVFGYGAKGAQGTGPGNTNIWPYIEMDIGTETVLHMACSESIPTGDDSTTITTISYYRRVGAYGFTSGTSNGVWSDQRVIDSNNMGDPIIVQDPNSDRVALVWMAPCAFNRGVDEENSFDNDVYYAFSDNQGADWASKTFPSISDDVENSVLEGGNITNYTDPGAPENWHLQEFGYSEVQGLFDGDGNLHVVWATRAYASDNEHVTFRDGGLYHWSEVNTTPSIVYKWPTRYGTIGNACVTLPDWMQEAGKTSLSMCTDGTLYVSFTKFGHDGLCDTEECDGLCTNFDQVNSGDQGGHAVGYLYTVASDDGGVLWDAPQRVTGRTTTELTGCYPDTADASLQCHSEMWGSMARYSRIETCGDSVGSEVLDVVYIDDLAPGGVVRGTGAMWTTNPVTWQVTSCREVVYIPEYDDDAGNGLGICYTNELLYVAPSGNTTATFHMTNRGLLDNNYSIGVNYTDGSGWISPSPSSGVIGRNNEDTVAVDLNITAPAGAADPSTWLATVVVTHDATNSPREIPVCLTVTSTVFTLDTATLATTCKQLFVDNVARLGNNTPDAALDYFDDCDTFTTQTDPTSYLYDGSPVIAFISGADTLRYMSYSSNSIYDDDAFIPMSDLIVDEVTYAGSYTFATAEYTTADTNIGCIVEYYIPTTADSCEFIIQRLKVFSFDGGTYNGVLVGEMIDWDVPSDSGSDNTSGYSNSDNAIWMVGYEYDDITNGDCGQLEDDRFGGVRVLEPATMKNGMTFDNATYVYTSGPYGTAAPLPAGVAYQLMKNEEGLSVYSSTDPDSVATDLSMLVTFNSYDIGPTDTFTIVMVLATGKDGEAAFLQSLADGADWADDKGLYSADCCVVAGDANNDGGLNIGDAVFLINHIFKGGPAPVCMNAADANHDCGLNIGDAVYLINHIFKGGAAPQCGCIN
ncbi:MAG: dockerin type I repeat-containing protein [Candidatus Zixiibacteriota bacterium]